MLEVDNSKQDKVTLESLSDLTGFPIEMIKTELFSGSDINEDSISLTDLRKAMMSYIDETMLHDSEK
jgi:glutaredoxin-related protein